MRTDLRRLKRDTESARTGPVGGPPVTPPLGWWRRWRWVAGGVLLALAIWQGWEIRMGRLTAKFGWLVREEAEAPKELRERRLTSNAPENALTTVAISPDGKYLAYADSTGVSVRLLASGETHPLPLPEDIRSAVWGLVWMPDGARLLEIGRASCRERV